MITITVKENKNLIESINKGSIVKNIITDTILLVTSTNPNTGTIIHSINPSKIGNIANMAILSEFELFKGIITIKCE